jgi:high-affinity nickel permease
MLDAEFLAILGLGFLLGTRHALDADHIAAVSTLLSTRPRLQTSGFIGLCWGLGHTLMLLIVGLAVILLKVRIPVPVAQTLEVGVGVMLIVLGSSLAWTIYRQQWHLHSHEHDGAHHAHLHRHEEREDHEHTHWMRLSVRPLCIGMVHGLAGSAALLLIVLSTVQTLWQGILYITVFGVGSIAGMVLIGFLISVPMVLSATYGGRAQALMQGLASMGSVALGIMILVRNGF